MPMPRLSAAVSVLALVAGSSALAAPRVAVDVAPVHAIVAAVMEGVGAPDLILPPGASPHGYALRPSDAGALEAADLVVWVGPELTPWMEGTIDALAANAARLRLTEADGVRLLPVREGGPFEAHVHDDDHDHDHDHGHDHSHAEDETGGHDHGLADGHLWLDPLNAAAIATATAGALAELDPENAGAYADNAAAFEAAMAALVEEIGGRLEPVRGARFVVFHDAYQYFEDRFGLPAAGAIALSDAVAPGPQRVAEIRDRIRGEDVVCVFAEPQFEPKLIATVIEGTPARTGTLDPLGSDLAPGPELYGALLRGLADGLVACLAPDA